MITQGFHIGNNDWWFMVYYDIETDNDLEKVYGALLAAGIGIHKANNAIKVLTDFDSGYIFTNEAEKTTIICISKATSYDEMFNTITHEIKHATEHLSSYYNVDPKSEKAAYLQGEISKQMYKAVALNICPCCNFKRNVGNNK